MDFKLTHHTRLVHVCRDYTRLEHVCRDHAKLGHVYRDHARLGHPFYEAQLQNSCFSSLTEKTHSRLLQSVYPIIHKGSKLCVWRVCSLYLRGHSFCFYFAQSQSKVLQRNFQSVFVRTSRSTLTRCLFTRLSCDTSASKNSACGVSALCSV